MMYIPHTATLGELLKNKETEAVLKKYLGDKLSEDSPMFGMMEGMTIEMLSDHGRRDLYG